MGSRRRSLHVRNNTTTTIGTSALIALGGLGCGRSPAPAPTASTTTIVNVAASPGQTAAVASAAPPTAPDAADAALAKELEAYAVTLPNVARTTLYTWTTRQQIVELEKDRVLLTRAESPEFGASYFDQVLEERAQTNDPLAKLLRTKAFARARYAWPFPFATRLGIGGESYGDELIKIVLKPEAWFVVLRISSKEIVVIDANNQPVSTADALAHPERIAAVYFVQDQPATGYRASLAGPNERVAYREYVICNESMVASFSVGTAEITAELETEAKMLEKVSQHLKTHPIQGEHWMRWMVTLATKTWATPPNSSSAVQTYEAALAFADFPYQPSTVSADQIVAKLRTVRAYDKPFTHIPTAKFAGSTPQVPAAPPRVVKPQSKGTF